MQSQILSLEFGQFNSSQQYKNFVKSRAYNSVFNYDLLVVSDTRLNQSIDSDDIWIEGFSNEIFRSDHPSNSRVPGGVCTYYKENVPIK